MIEETGAKTGAASWRRYPHLQSAIETETAAVLANLEQTRTEIEGLSRTGSVREQERARTVLLAYTRALELYRDLAERRDQLVHASSNMRSGAPINE